MAQCKKKQGFYWLKSCYLIGCFCITSIGNGPLWGQFRFSCKSDPTSVDCGWPTETQGGSAQALGSNSWSYQITNHLLLHGRFKHSLKLRWLLVWRFLWGKQNAACKLLSLERICGVNQRILWVMWGSRLLPAFKSGHIPHAPRVHRACSKVFFIPWSIKHLN